MSGAVSVNGLEGDCRQRSVDMWDVQQPVVDEHADILVFRHVNFRHQIKITARRIQFGYDLAQEYFARNVISLAGATPYLDENAFHQSTSLQVTLALPWAADKTRDWTQFRSLAGANP